MVDLSKHLTRARKAIDGRNYDLAIEICLECQEVDPTNVKNYELLIEAAQRRAQESGKKGMRLGLSMTMSRDPHKLLSGAIKAMSKNPDMKTCAAAGDAARAVMDTGVKKMVDVTILLYEEARKTGMFNIDVLWYLAHAYLEKFEQSKGKDAIDNAIARMAELNKSDKGHKEAGRTLKNWEAMRSMGVRSDNRSSGDYRSQMADDGDARKNEVMGRQIRTVADADEVLSFIDIDLKANDQDKGMWMKRADVLRRVQRWDQARESLEKARALDGHDFTIVMRIGEIGMQEIKDKILNLEKAGSDSTEAKDELLNFEVSTYRDWIQRQPTEFKHKFELARRLFQLGEIDESAQLFQKSLNDPQNKCQSHKYLGHCFAKKKLFDMAIDQFSKCLDMLIDKNGKESMEVLYNRARLLEKIKKNKLAITDYTSLVERDLGFKDAATRLAELKALDREE